jgi:hypothetical protein
VLHVALSYRGRRRVGAFLTSSDLEHVRRLRAADQPGRVPALDSRARPITIRVEDLLEDPDVLGYGIDLTDDERDERT